MKPNSFMYLISLCVLLFLGVEQQARLERLPQITDQSPFQHLATQAVESWMQFVKIYKKCI